MSRKFRFNAYTGGVLAGASAFVAALAWSGASRAAAPGPTPHDLEQRFNSTIRPFLQTYCVSCHGKVSPQAQLDLTGYASMASVTRDYAHWSLVMDRISAKQMPPAAMKQPSDAQRDAVTAWIRAAQQAETLRNAGDPGPVPPRRLSNAEYDYTIRDLTGVDLRPTREFPVDPANQEGFDNSGESLTLSSALMKKYFQAARDISEKMALNSDGLGFASHPVLAETDRDKYSILRIVDFYKRQPTDFADYFEAAWRYRHRLALGSGTATLQTVAAQAKISPRYLETVWTTLNTPGVTVGPLAKLQTQWNALPRPERPAGMRAQSDTASAVVHTQCVAMRDWVVGMRKKVAAHYNNLPVPRGFSNGGQCFVLWKDRQYATHRRSLNTEMLQIDGVPATHIVPQRRNRGQAQPPKTVVDALDAELFVPKDETARAPYLASFSQFCSVFPDAFYIAERGRMFVDDAGDKGRLLTAGLHNSMGYFRDDTPLMEMLLDDDGRRELDRMWLDFNMVAFVPERMHSEFFVYERAESGTITDPEFNFARAEDKDALSDAKIKLLGDLYLAKARKNGAEPITQQAIIDHFKWVSTTIRATERARLAAEPAQLRSLLGFAERAYRRPLTEADRSDLLAFYHTLRQKEGLSHEDALRDTVVSVLMSPNFLFRLDLEGAEGAFKPAPLAAPRAGTRAASVRHAAYTPPSRAATNLTLSGLSASTLSKTLSNAVPNIGSGAQPLPDYALASRLSYFLWSSMPDKELLAHAGAGDLHRPEVLAAQSRRMLRDPRVRALALEFGGNWLDFRRFEEYNAVDRTRFPAFNDELREAMFEEPLHFLMDTFQQDRSVLDLLYGKYTFVNASLAKHYGMTDIKPSPGEWIRVNDATRYGRGGLLPMSVFLTQNSPGLRTSPVKRGYWMVKRVLGETIPPPPPNVPALPADESKMGDVTLRQALSQHRANPACAGCHARFDSYGLVFEGYGPTGELRSKDLGGKPIDAHAPFPGGADREGVTGLQDFVHQQRQKDFVANLSRKTLSYALGRSLQPSDEPLLQQMQQRLTANDYRFGALVEAVVTSPQFRSRRAPITNLARN